MKMQLLTTLIFPVSVSAVLPVLLSATLLLKGPPPAEIKTHIAAEPMCGAAHSETVTTRHYLVGKDGGLANVFVYIKSGVEGKTFSTPSETPTIDQIGCLYEPYVSGVMVNQKFKIKNS